MPLYGEARNIYQRLWTAARRATWFKDKACVKCGEVENLEIHHTDPTTKVTHRIWNWSKQRREEELAKCEVLCKDCHKLETLFRGRPKETDHGSSNFWNTRKCRCDICRAWHRNQMREFRSKRIGVVVQRENATFAT